MLVLPRCANKCRFTPDEITLWLFLLSTPFQSTNDAIMRGQNTQNRHGRETHNTHPPGKSIFICFSSLHPMSCWLHDIGCTEVKQTNMLTSVGRTHHKSLAIGSQFARQTTAIIETRWGICLSVSCEIWDGQMAHTKSFYRLSCHNYRSNNESHLITKTVRL